MKQDNNKSIDIWEFIYPLIVISMIILKALKVIELSWVWVLLPLWAPMALVVIVSVLYAVILFVICLVGLGIFIADEIRERKKSKNRE